MTLTIEQRRDARLRATYGISEEQFITMDAAQGGVCAICLLPPRLGRVLVVDHNHDLGVVRGLLCSECNTGLGLLGDDPVRLRAAIAYLMLHGSYPEGGQPSAGTAPPAAVQSHIDLRDRDRPPSAQQPPLPGLEG